VSNSEHALLGHQEIGNSFDGVYYVERVSVKQTKQSKDYLDLALRDKSGSRFLKFWGTVDGLQKGDWVFVSAGVEEYMGNPSVIVKNIEIVSEPDDLSPYMPVYDDVEKYAGDFDIIREELKRLEESGGGNTAGTLVDEVYGNSKFFERFVVAPGGTGSHYGRRGGLLACTVRAADGCIKVVDNYRLTNRDKSILIASALLCRIGAIDAFEFQDCAPVETKRGILLGLNNLTMTRVSSALKRVIAAFQKDGKVPDQEVIIRLLHAITAYNGRGVIPSTTEALILQSVVRMDSEIVDAIEFIERDVNKGEEFTAYDPVLRRRYYVG